MRTRLRSLIYTIYPNFLDQNPTRKHYIKKQVLTPLIAYKWLKDKQNLKLTKNHWLLYRNIHIEGFFKNRRFPNLQNGETLNDKINWLKLFDQDELKINLADKIEVKKFIQNRLKDNRFYANIIKIYDDNRKIDINELPPKFVLKTNHDCGGTAVIDKKSMSKEEISNKINKIQTRLGNTYGYPSGEWHYLLIKPKIFAEEFIQPQTTYPSEYRAYCSNGKVLWITYVIHKEETKDEVVIMPNGSMTKLKENINSKTINNFKLPYNWSQLLDIARALSQDLTFVRVDMSNENNNPRVGELTFASMGGFFDMSKYTDITGNNINGQYYLGNLIKINRENMKKPIYSESIIKKMKIRNLLLK